MATVKEVSVSVRQVKNLGNYQSYTAEASVVMQVDAGDDADMVFLQAWKTVQGEVDKQIKKA